MLKSQISQARVNPQAFAICQTLSKAGYQAYIVGGCVRDLLLGQVPKDWDITTDASPQEVMELFPKTYPTGLQHGTITVAMGEGVENHFEVTTFRIEGEYKDGRRPEEVFFVLDVEQDLARRDLTINAIAYDPIMERMVDPFDGLQDLKNGIIRAVGKPEARFQEDGLRIMRVARFAARFGYLVEQETIQGMSASMETLKKVSKERIQDELSKTLMTSSPNYGFSFLFETGVLEITNPLLFTSTLGLYFLPLLHKCPGELETRLALLYSAFKPEEVQKELINLKFSSNEINKVCFLLKLMNEFGGAINIASCYRRFIALIKNEAPASFESTLEQFILLLKAREMYSVEFFEGFKNEIVFSRKEMEIDGFDLITLMVKPGPQMKSLLNACYQEILQHPEHNNKEFLCKFVSSQLYSNHE
jgi:tRNA nucleotidyltransferase (CCA-adding enzyme)